MRQPYTAKQYQALPNPHKPQNLLATQNNCVEQPPVQQQLGQRKTKLSHDRRHAWNLIVLFSDQIHPPLLPLRHSLTGYTLHAAWRIYQTPFLFTRQDAAGKNRQTLTYFPRLLLFLEMRLTQVPEYDQSVPSLYHTFCTTTDMFAPGTTIVIISI